MAQGIHQMYSRPSTIRRLVVVTAGLLFFLLVSPMLILGTDEGGGSGLSTWKDFWLLRLSMNVLGYASIIIPAVLVIRYIQTTNYLDTAAPGRLTKVLRLFVYGQSSETGILDESPVPVQESRTERTFFAKCMLLAFCFFGLQGSYLTWGLLQERIMAHTYGSTDTSPGENFKDSQFLVFVNRILAFIIACLVIFLRRQPRHTAPMYKYSYGSFSNIMSSWFQYEALKYVSFPTQVLAKASKIIPVMIMGKVVSKKTFQYYEYLTAVMISVGVGVFLLNSGDVVKHKNTVTTFSGVILLLGYLFFDAFTSNWQGELFSTYKMSSIQMMAGVNLFSVIFTSVTLWEQGGFATSVSFMLRHPLFNFHVVLLSICSATGQLFIFYTISQFGPVTFIIIMTMRQGLAILLSCIIYSHPVTPVGVFGVFIVFLAMFIRIYLNQKGKKAKKPIQSTEIQALPGAPAKS